jgi:uncharacterized protein DUF5678
MARPGQIINEVRSLSRNEKLELRQALDDEVERQQAEYVQPVQTNNGDDDKTRERRLEWLKSHRDEFGGQYVALDRDRLIAVGPTYRSARQKASAAGKPEAFVTYLPKSDEIAQMGG